MTEFMHKPPQRIDMVEEIHNTREVEESRKKFGRFYTQINPPVQENEWGEKEAFGSDDIENFWIDVLHQELQKTREQRKGWKGYVVVDPKADNYKYSPVFSDRKGAELWVKGKEINGLEVVEVDILLADQSELDQPITSE